MMVAAANPNLTVPNPPDTGIEWECWLGLTFDWKPCRWSDNPPQTRLGNKVYSSNDRENAVQVAKAFNECQLADNHGMWAFVFKHGQAAPDMLVRLG